MVGVASLLIDLLLFFTVFHFQYNYLVNLPIKKLVFVFHIFQVHLPAFFSGMIYWHAPLPITCDQQEFLIFLVNVSVYKVSTRCY